MKTRFSSSGVAFYLAYLLLGVFLGVIAGMLFAGAARAQVTDLPIPVWPTAAAARGHVTALRTQLPAGACVSYWYRSPSDRYAPWQVARLAVSADWMVANAPAVTAMIAKQDIPGLLKMRTGDMDSEPLSTISKACEVQLARPAGPWVVAPATSGKRPVYALAPDGSSRVPVAVPGYTAIAGARVDCTTRVVERSSTYCLAGTGSGLVLLALAKETP